MIRAPRQAGYALLAALFITALAAVFAAACVAAVAATLSVTRSDRSASAAEAGAERALDKACAGLRRRPDRLVWSAAGTEAGSGVFWRLDCAADSQTETTSGVLADVVTAAACAGAQRRLQAVVALRAVPQAQGLEVTHDVRLRAPLTVSGGGLYCGGSVSGREWVRFDGGGGPAAPADAVHGALWPLAAVHALGGVWASGAEVHEAASRDPACASDTDVHTGAGPVEELTRPAEPEILTLLHEAADLVLTPGDGEVVDLAGLPTSPASGAAALVVVVAALGETPVVVAGERPASSCPLVLVLEGDSQLGMEGSSTSVTGAVLACGSLIVGGQTGVVGHVSAASLTTDAPLDVTTPPDWRLRLLPCLVQPVIMALGR